MLTNIIDFAATILEIQYTRNLQGPSEHGLQHAVRRYLRSVQQLEPHVSLISIEVSFFDPKIYEVPVPAETTIWP